MTDDNTTTTGEEQDDNEYGVPYTAEDLARFKATTEQLEDAGREIKPDRNFLNPPSRLRGIVQLLLIDSEVKTTAEGIPYAVHYYEDDPDDPQDWAEFTVAQYQKIPNGLIQDAVAILEGDSE